MRGPTLEATPLPPARRARTSTRMSCRGPLGLSSKSAAPLGRTLGLTLGLALLSGCERRRDDAPRPITLGSAASTSGPLVLTPDRPAPNVPHLPGPQAPGPTAPTAPTTPPATPSTVGPPSPTDPVTTAELGYLRARAQAVLQRLVGALEPKQRGEVQGIPLGFDPTAGEVNAFAACRKSKGPLMVISDDLMRIQAGVARAEAYDEVFGTTRKTAYFELVRTQRSPVRAVPTVPAGFYEPAKDADGRKVARQRQLFDEELAFVLGHELAHHYLSHTGCVGGDASATTPADLARALATKAPVFNQPNEAASDIYGTHNAMTAGFTERGGLLTLELFLSLRGGGGGLRFSFEDSHPDPSVRIPIVKQAAATFRSTGGRPLPVLTLPRLP